MSTLPRGIHRIDPGAFQPENHWYPAALNATIHPMVAFLMHMRSDQIVARYCHLHPSIDPENVRALLHYKPKYFLHSGTDLIHATNDQGNRSMVVIETNSCPSGQKSMPLRRLARNCDVLQPLRFTPSCASLASAPLQASVCTVRLDISTSSRQTAQASRHARGMWAAAGVCTSISLSPRTRKWPPDTGKPSTDRNGKREHYIT